MRDVVWVVTATRNARQFLEQTIVSVVQQRGDFEVHYHIQDGGSTDDTLAIAHAWVDRLAAGDGRCQGGAIVHMSVASGKDGSMYDAIQAGMEFLENKAGPLDRERIAMTWINADDVFSPGAFQTVLGFLSAHPDRSWVTGIPSTIAANGTICDVREPPHAFSRYHLASGAHDGRERPFMQQEGTFWTHALWSSVGGLNRHLRLAGDLDLWRRMARHAEVIVLQAVLAFHRDRSGQLSADLDAYWLEVDGLAGVGAQRPSELSQSGHVGWTAARQSGADAWTIKAVSVERPNEIAGFLSGSRVLHAAFGDSVMPRWLRDLSGLSRPEGWGRWSDALLAPSARITVVHPLPGHAVVRLKMGVLRKECSPLVVTIGHQRFEVEAAGEPSHFLFELDSSPGADVIDVRPTRTFSPHEINGSADRRQLGVALFTLEIAIRRELL